MSPRRLRRDVQCRPRLSPRIGHRDGCSPPDVAAPDARRCAAAIVPHEQFADRASLAVSSMSVRRTRSGSSPLQSDARARRSSPPMPVSVMSTRRTQHSPRRSRIARFVPDCACRAPGCALALLDVINEARLARFTSTRSASDVDSGKFDLYRLHGHLGKLTTPFAATRCDDPRHLQPAASAIVVASAADDRREPNRELRSASRSLARGLDRPSMQLNEVLHDREAQPQSPVAPAA